jgi:hypothetical protein
MIGIYRQIFGKILLGIVQGDWVQLKRVSDKLMRSHLTRALRLPAL